MTPALDPGARGPCGRFGQRVGRMEFCCDDLPLIGDRQVIRSSRNQMNMIADAAVVDDIDPKIMCIDQSAADFLLQLARCSDFRCFLAANTPARQHPLLWRLVRMANQQHLTPRVAHNRVATMDFGLAQGPPHEAQTMGNIERKSVERGGYTRKHRNVSARPNADPIAKIAQVAKNSRWMSQGTDVGTSKLDTISDITYPRTSPLKGAVSRMRTRLQWSQRYLEASQLRP